MKQQINIRTEVNIQYHITDNSLTIILVNNIKQLIILLVNCR